MQLIKKYYFIFTLFISGAAIMSLELAGTRVVAPVYGSGLFVWAALIIVTMTCLSLGYWFGGRFSDRLPSIEKFYFIFLLAGLTVAPIPWISIAVLRLSVAFGFKLGPLFSAYVLFGFPLFLLGMISPYALKLAAKELDDLGSKAGNIYAISTIGSLLGTVLTAFVLVPNYGSKKIFFVLSVILILIWVVSKCIMSSNIASLKSATFLVIPMLLTYVSPAFYNANSNVSTVYETESYVGQINVLDFEDKRFLFVDNICQSIVNRKTMEPEVPAYYMFELVTIFNKHGKDAFLVGMAGANIPFRFFKYGIKTDSVDIEPKMTYVAKKYFGFRDEYGGIYNADGRSYIKNMEKKYDYIILDAFSGCTIPFHLLTRESFGEVSEKLKERGILAINYYGFLRGEKARGWKSVYKTLNSVFKNVRVFYHRDTMVTNIIFFASDNNLDIPVYNTFFCDDNPSADMFRMFLKNEITLQLGEGQILTDDFSPIDFFRKDVREKSLKFSEDIYFKNENNIN